CWRQADAPASISIGGRAQIQHAIDRSLCSDGIAAGGSRFVCRNRLSSLTTDKRDWDSSRPRRNTPTHSAFDDGSRNEIDADRCNDRICRSNSGHTSNEKSFVCSRAHRSNDLWHFLGSADRRRIIGLFYPCATGNESRSTSRAKIRITFVDQGGRTKMKAVSRRRVISTLATG